MTKEPKTKSLTLSRFFYKNMNTVKSENSKEGFKKSADFSIASVENKIIEKNNNERTKILGPQFKGFTKEKIKQAEKDKEKAYNAKKRIFRLYIKSLSNKYEQEEESNTSGNIFKSQCKEFTNQSKRQLEIDKECKAQSSQFVSLTNEYGKEKECSIKRKLFDPHCKELSNQSTKQLGIEFNAERENLASQLKGFSKEDQEQAKIRRYSINVLVAKFETNVDQSRVFLGFSQDEIDCANKFCDKNSKEVEYFENNTFNYFRGFSKKEQNESVSQLSDIVEKCVSVRNEIYKNIDRRILTYHLKEARVREKVVCSKYWPKQESLGVELEGASHDKRNEVKLENCAVSSLKINQNHHKRNGIKIETIKTESKAMKQESNFLSEIHKIKEDLKTMQKNSLSSTKEIKPEEAPFIKIKQELIIPPFIPPKSPHHLIEEDLYHDPWALLVATIFLNKTSGRSARPYIFWFLYDNPDPLVVLAKKVQQLETYFGALGLQKTRASQVWRMSHDFIYKKWKKVSELYGIGRYGEEAFRMFCLGDLSFEPKDRYLRIYRAWYEMQERKARIKEMNS